MHAALVRVEVDSDVTITVKLPSGVQRQSRHRLWPAGLRVASREAWSLRTQSWRAHHAR